MNALFHAMNSPHCHVKKLITSSFLSFNQDVSPESEIKLLQAVAKNKSLQILDYTIANPSDDVFAALAHLLKQHTTLSEVSLLEPVDSIEGVLLLVQAMKESNMTHLQLRLNTRMISEARWMEVLTEHSFPTDKISLSFRYRTRA